MWPQSQETFLQRALPRLKQDPRLLGVAVGGSRVNKEIDEFSDLDLVLVCKPDSYASVIEDREILADGLGHRLVGFAGDHLGEPRLLVNLYDDPLLHVDLKFVSLLDFPERIEDPEILWENNEALSKVIWESKPNPPHPDLQWIENRFWVWLHYGAQRLGRGEIFETIDLLSFLRAKALGPLILWKKGFSARGVRRIEKYGEEYLSSLRATVPLYDPCSCETSLREAAKLYVDLRETLASASLVRHRRTEMACMGYLHQVRERLNCL
jgi:predicted nucleotidyltransferase